MDSFSKEQSISSILFQFQQNRPRFKKNLSQMTFFVENLGINNPPIWEENTHTLHVLCTSSWPSYWESVIILCSKHLGEFLLYNLTSMYFLNLNFAGFKISNECGRKLPFFNFPNCIKNELKSPKSSIFIYDSLYSKAESHDFQ